MFSTVLDDEVDFYFDRFEREIIPLIGVGNVPDTTLTDAAGKLEVADGEWATSYPSSGPSAIPVLPTPRSTPIKSAHPPAPLQDNANAGSSANPNPTSSTRKQGTSFVPSIEKISRKR